jgi:hypothetical protein
LERSRPIPLNILQSLRGLPQFNPSWKWRICGTSRFGEMSIGFELWREIEGGER